MSQTQFYNPIDTQLRVPGYFEPGPAHFLEIQKSEEAKNNARLEQNAQKLILEEDQIESSDEDEMSFGYKKCKKSLVVRKGRNNRTLFTVLSDHI